MALAGAPPHPTHFRHGLHRFPFYQGSGHSLISISPGIGCKSGTPDCSPDFSRGRYTTRSSLILGRSQNKSRVKSNKIAISPVEKKHDPKNQVKNRSISTRSPDLADQIHESIPPHSISPLCCRSFRNLKSSLYASPTPRSGWSSVIVLGTCGWYSAFSSTSVGILDQADQVTNYTGKISSY